uniref:Uncharacterized protein n=1 Tax=Oncorhynchus mykiss TaxID=8022 RepID=A0A8C7T946_ONCMY
MTVLSYTSLSVSLSEALTEELNQGVRPLKQNAEKKFCSCSLLRVNNNNNNNNNNNIITDFNNVLVELKELRVLYCHDKSICNLSEVDKLGALPFLHGNTMENEGIIQTFSCNACGAVCVIAALPHLLDFCAVTGQDRIMAQVWHHPSNHSKTPGQLSWGRRNSTSTVDVTLTCLIIELDH